MARAIAAFLEAAGQSLTGELAGTPERVAQTWASDFLDGEGIAPREALGSPLAAPGAGLVCVTGIDFHSMCPHHMLPYRGLAHVAYLPARQVVGFSGLACLVDVLAHRLVLQEVLARQIAEGLREAIDARGAGCVLAVEQACLTCRGRARRRARVTAEAFSGRFPAAERARFSQAVAAGAGEAP